MQERDNPVNLPFPGRRARRVAVQALVIALVLSTIVSPIAPYLPQLLDALGLGPNNGMSPTSDAARAQDESPGVPLAPGTVKYGSRSKPFYSQVSDGTVPPRLVATPEALLYHTSFGTYSFNRSTPFIFTLLSQRGTPLTLGSIFMVASDSPLTPESGNVTIATDNQFQTQYTVLSGAVKVGILSLRADFSADARPKFTVRFAKTANWTLGDFNIVWSTVPVQSWLATGESSAYDITKITTQAFPPSLTVDVGPTSNPSNWREWVTTDWSDAGGGTLHVGEVSLGVESRKGFTVTFPTNQGIIDPTQVGSTSNFYGATGYPTQRKTFYYGSYYFLFWHDGTSIVYASSSDGISWSLPHFVASDVISFWSFDVATRGPRVAVLWYGQNQFGDNTGLWLKKGTVFGSSIAWDSGTFGVAAVPSGSAVFPASLAMGEDGQFWAAGVWHDGSSNYRVWVYNSTDGVYFAENVHYAVSCPSDPEVAYEETVQLTPLFRGGMMLFSTGFCDTMMHWRTWNPISAVWSPAQNLTLGLAPGMTKFNLVSATTSVDGFVHLLYSPGGEQVSWAYYSNATSQWTLGGQVYNGASMFPTISSDSLGNLYAFWFQGFSVATSYPMYSWKPKGSGLSQGWSAPIQPFGPGPSGIAAWGLSAARFSSKQVFAVWTVDTCGPCSTYQIFFGSLPLPAGVASAPPSQPWNRLGLPSSVGDGEYVPPGNGLLTVSQTDISVPGRNGLSFSIGRMYIQPYTFLQGNPFNFENSPYTNLGNGWQLNLPWVGSEYVHLISGQMMPIVWTNITKTGQTTSWRFDNHDGEDFSFSKTNSSGTITFSLTMNDGTTYNFNGSGLLSLIADRTGQNKIQFTYNPVTGLLSSVKDTVNRTAVFSYNANNRLTSATYGGQTVSYGYSGNSLTTVTDQLSNTITFEYSPTNSWLIRSIRYPTGGNSTYTYGSATIGTDAINHYVTLQNLYNPGNLVRSSNFTYEISDGTVTYTAIAQSNGTSIQGYRDYQFNPRAKSSTTTIFDASRTQLRKTTEWFDSKGRPSQEDVYSGNTNTRSYYTTSAYDSWGNIIYSRDPTGHATYSSYANTDTQYTFQDYGSLNTTTNGRVFYDDFNLPAMDTSAWTEGGNAEGRSATTSFSLLSLRGYSPTQGTWKASWARTLASFNFPLYAEVQMEVPPNTGSGAVQATMLFSSYITGGDPSLLSNYLSVSLNTGGAYNVTKKIGGVKTQLYSWVNPGAVSGQWKIVLTDRYNLKVFLDQGLGLKQVYASNSLDLDITPAYIYLVLHNQNTVTYSASFDYIGLSTSNTITVNGLESGQRVDLVDWNGVTQETKIQYSGPLALNGTSTVFPYASLVVYAKDDLTVQLMSPTRDVWGGNVYSYTAPFRSGGVHRTYSGFVTSYTTYVDESTPAGASLFSSGGDSWAWARNGNGPVVSGGSSHFSASAVGEHRHYFQGGTPTLTAYSGFFLVQYVYIPTTTVPREIMLEFRDTSGSWEHRAYWGNDLIARGINGTVSRHPMGPLPETRDSWALLEVRVDDVGLAGLTIDGISYTLYDGSIFWDYTAIQLPLSGNAIRVGGLVPGQKVEVYDFNGVMRTSATVSAGQSIVDLFLYDNGFKTFPFIGSLRVYSASGSLQYLSPLTTNVWPGDIYSYHQPVFSNSFSFQAPDGFIHNAQVGRATYQNQTTTAVASYSSYDSIGDLTVTTSLHNTSKLNTTYSYDSFGNLLSSVNPKQQLTNYTYSATYRQAYLTNVTQILSPGVSIITSYVYDFTTGNKLAIIDPRGNRTDYQYDVIGRPTVITYPSVGGVRAEVRTTYIDYLNAVDVRNEKGNYTRVLYDGLGRKTTVKWFSGDPSTTVLSTEQYAYDWQGKIKKYTAPDGNYTTYSYDYMGRQTRVSNPDLSSRTASYDDLNRVQTSLDENLHRKDYLYDMLQRLVAVREYYSSSNYYTTSYTYDSLGNLVKAVDSKGQTTTYSYDDLNRLAVTKFPDGFNITRTYDNVGNIVSRKDPNGNNVTYSYDNVNRPTTITYPGGSQAAFSYDKNGNRVAMSNGNSTTTFAYDARNRETSETWTIAGSVYTLAYGYDSVGNMISITYPEGTVARFSVDALNRVTEAKKGTATLATFAYSGNMKLGSISYDNGVVTSYTYDSRSRPLKIKTVKNQNTLLDLNYGYDNTGNVKTITNLAGGSSIEYYSFDFLNRLTNSTGPWTGQPGLLYGYDSVGNRVWTKDGTGANITYTYGPYNRLSSVGSTSFTYYNNGNTKTQTTSSVTTDYYYDFENRLTKVTRASSTLGTYAYSPLGARILSIESGTTTVSLSLGTSVVYEKKGSTQNLYIQASGLLIAKLSGNNKFFHHQDHLGNTRLVTKGSQTEFSTNYKPFGPQYGASGSDPVYKYTGKPQSSGTQLYYYGARWYNSTIGRFLTRDPTPGRLSNPQSLNLYAYVLNNPLRYVDPTGNRECAWYDAVCHGSNVVESASNAWNSLPPEYQEAIILGAAVALTVATGGVAAPLLIAGAIGFGAGVGAYVGYTYATGGTPTLAGALSWGNMGFSLGTGVAGLAKLGLSGARAGVSAAERLAANRAAGLAWESKVSSVLGWTRNVGPGRATVEGTMTARSAVPDFYAQVLGEAKFTMNLRSLTPQLRVLIEASAQEGRPLHLALPEGARIVPRIFEYAEDFLTEVIPHFL